jgi:alkylation response protein AidB-like acyl-CoA dehydrogenase
MSTALMQTEEIAALRETVEAVCQAAGGTQVVRTLPPDGPGYSEAVWRVLTDEIGLGGLGLPEEFGGLGGLAELAVVAEILGAAMIPVPFLSSTVLSGQLLSRCGPAAAAVLDRLAGGEVVASVLLDADGRWNPRGLPIRADQDEQGWVLEGTANFVLDGPGARRLVVVAATPDGPAVFTLESTGAGVEIQAQATLDLARAQARVRLFQARATMLATGPDVAARVESAVDVALVVQSAEQLGGAQAALDLTVDYVRSRRQFGRAIGSFQAVKHRCADMLVLVETARSAVGRAVAAVDLDSAGPGGPGSGLAEAASVANAWCSQALVEVSASAVHLHGGMGFTWEHDAQLYFRRARADAALLGDPTFHRERLARLLAW